MQAELAYAEFMSSRAPRPACVPIVSRWLGAALLSFACGSPAPEPGLDAASMSKGMQAEAAPAPTPAELSQPTEEDHDLWLTLGGQTGSEMTQGILDCAPLHTRYDVDQVTPLGFAAASVAAAITAHEYWLSGLGWEGAVGVTVELNSSATFINRDPEASPELVCVDAVEIAATFVISAEGSSPISLEVILYADAPEHFAGGVLVEAAALQGALADAAAGADVVVAVEGLGDGVRLWFYRNVQGTREPIGRVVPVP
jgi:hypothetical protein